jgi:hypothetical protein
LGRKSSDHRFQRKHMVVATTEQGVKLPVVMIADRDRDRNNEILRAITKIIVDRDLIAIIKIGDRSQHWCCMN